MLAKIVREVFADPAKFDAVAIAAAALPAALPPAPPT
jgi:hypothetical protein